MKLKNLHDDKIIIVAKDGKHVANPGEIIEIDEKTYNQIKTIYTKFEVVGDEAPKAVKPEKPKVTRNANKKSK